MTDAGKYSAPEVWADIKVLNGDPERFDPEVEFLRTGGGETGPEYSESEWLADHIGNMDAETVFEDCEEITKHGTWRFYGHMRYYPDSGEVDEGGTEEFEISRVEARAGELP